MIQEYHLNIEEIGNLTFYQFQAMLDLLALQSEEVDKATKDQDPAKGRVISDPAQQKAMLMNMFPGAKIKGQE